jgi:hypothetical protein
MTYPRVNLLYKNERRFQGAVSQKFILISAIATPLLLVGILAGIQFVHYTWVQSNLRTSREIWKNLQPRIALYQEERQGLGTTKQAFDLFQGWEDSKVSLDALLADIQDIVPEEIQFTRLSLRSANHSAVYKTVADLKLDCSLTIQGLAHGERAEHEVIDFRKTLLESEQVESMFETVRLASMRKRLDKDGSSMREFTLQGESLEGGVQ